MDDAVRPLDPERLAINATCRGRPKIVAIISIVESCRRLDVPLKDYLPDVLPGLLNPGFAVRLLWNQDSVRAAWEQRIDQPACHMDQIRRDAVLEAIQEL